MATRNFYRQERRVVEPPGTATRFTIRGHKRWRLHSVFAMLDNSASAAPASLRVDFEAPADNFLVCSSIGGGEVLGGAESHWLFGIGIALGNIAVDGNALFTGPLPGHFYEEDMNIAVLLANGDAGSVMQNISIVVEYQTDV